MGLCILTFTFIGFTSGYFLILLANSNIIENLLLQYIHLRQATYITSHIDIDTSPEKVKNLLYQSIPTCFQQFHFLWRGVNLCYYCFRKGA